jgi:hypothetical protein
LCTEKGRVAGWVQDLKQVGPGKGERELLPYVEQLLAGLQKTSLLLDAVFADGSVRPAGSAVSAGCN